MRSSSSVLSVIICAKTNACSNKVFFVEPIALISIQANVYDEQAADQKSSC